MNEKVTRPDTFFFRIQVPLNKPRPKFTGQLAKGATTSEEKGQKIQIQLPLSRSKHEWFNFNLD